MQVVRDRDSLRSARAALPEPVGLVPTMGALHAGHESLLARARADNASTIASLFVNPAQFGGAEDLERYPRDEAADLERFESAGIDVAFVPAVGAVYPSGFSTWIDVGRLGEVLEGAFRPGHFRGVATVVAILFTLTRAARAYFGQKDGQQAVVVRRLARDLGMGVEVVVCPTVREPDGLALSSRNRYLGADERRAAAVLHRALGAAEAAFRAGERDAERLRERMRATLAEEPLARPDYVSIVESETLTELELIEGPALASLAVRFPSARLIDCVPLG